MVRGPHSWRPLVLKHPDSRCDPEAPSPKTRREQKELGGGLGHQAATSKEALERVSRRTQKNEAT